MTLKYFKVGLAAAELNSMQVSDTYANILFGVAAVYESIKQYDTAKKYY